MRRIAICAVVLAVAGLVAPLRPAGAADTAAGCSTDKICLWNQPNFTGKMIVQQGGRCQRPADADFGPIRSIRNWTTKKPDGGQWVLRTWTADDCNCSRSCAEQWDHELKAGQEWAKLDPAQKSYEAVFVEPDCPKC
ncbi:MAG TPA: peptidase inhibitor family I36 protein [Acidimicrobiia bacterium]|jgi:hypothetical protein